LIFYTHPQHHGYVAVDSTNTAVIGVLNRIRNIVDSPGGNPEIEPQLATVTADTTGRRGATLSQCYCRENTITYLLSCTVSKLLLIIGQSFASDKGVPYFNTLAGVIAFQYHHE